MKKHSPIIIFLFCVLADLSAQQVFSYSKDTFLVNSGSNRMIEFGNWSNETTITSNKVFLPFVSFHSSPSLFHDFVYFDPEENLICDNRSDARRNNFMITGNLANERTSTSIPASILFYLDTTGMKYNYFGKLILPSIPTSSILNFLQPFYFSKYEVSNKEYREFVNYVRDSIARTNLKYINTNGKIDWAKKLDYSDTNIQNQSGLYYKKMERFWHLPEVNTRLLTYKFQNAPSEYGSDTILIYPDTLSWVNDFAYFYNEPMTNMYFWHPAYNDYPVVGVNYWQCLAFLEWKTNKMNAELKKQGKSYHVECKLPSAAEWDYASTAISKNGKIELVSNHYSAFCDNSWLTDLRLSAYPEVKISFQTKSDSSENLTLMEAVDSKKNFFPYAPIMNEEDYLLRANDIISGDFVSDGYFQTAPINPNGKRRFPSTRSAYKTLQENPRHIAHTDNATGICYLDGNVSEWLRNDLDSNWRAIFTKHISQLNDPKISEAGKIALETENLYYKMLPLHGKLVRGGNWVDERYNNNYGKNTAGTNAKTFVDPAKSHCTLGFRYVIYVYPN
ncbi:hypothetical protein BH09BAC5_BH09BAC5_23640 [soil metagenome]